MTYQADPSDNASVDVQTLHEAIRTRLRAAFTTQAVPTIDFHARLKEKFISPAIFFELTGIDGNPETQTEQFDGVFKFSAFCVVPYNAPNAILAARSLACQLVTKVQGNRWGVPIGLARVVRLEPELFEGDVPPYEMVRVDWEQEGVLGVSVFNEDGAIVPTEIWAGFEPNVGPDHIDDYVQVETLPETQ